MEFLEKISIIGIGNFGYALLYHLSRKQKGKNHFNLYAVDRNKQLIDNLKLCRRHLYHHKEIKIEGNITFTSNLGEAVDNADLIIIAVPSDSIREIISAIKIYVKREFIILNTAKALDNVTGERLSVIIEKLLDDIVYPYHLATLAGGTIAGDLLKENTLGVDIAGNERDVLLLLKDLFSSDNLNVYVTDDMVGVEYAAAFKNVIAIMAGIINGLGFSYGSETHISSRAAGEVKRLITCNMGGKAETFSMETQCWGNDLWMSCTGNTRNREYGILVGKGINPQTALCIMGEQNKTVEGINTIRVLDKLINGENKSYPILNAIKEIILEDKNPREIITNLMVAKIM